MAFVARNSVLSPGSFPNLFLLSFHQIIASKSSKSKSDKDKKDSEDSKYPPVDVWNAPVKFCSYGMTCFCAFFCLDPSLRFNRDWIIIETLPLFVSLSLRLYRILGFFFHDSWFLVFSLFMPTKICSVATWSFWWQGKIMIFWSVWRRLWLPTKAIVYL